jgi:preprotein translocase subunit SecG
MWGFLIGLLWVLLSLSMILLIAVILLQEGKGGGLAEAFGGAGAETFGVKATGINRFTAVVGALFLTFAVLINLCLQWQEAAPVGPEPELDPASEFSIPANPGAGASPIPVNPGAGGSPIPVNPGAGGSPPPANPGAGASLPTPTGEDGK